MESAKPAAITQKAESTRQRILDTALDLFSQKGYEQTTMHDIAAEAECSLGLAYRYFASKEEIVLGLYRQCAHEHETYVEQNLPTIAPSNCFQQTMHFTVQQAYTIP